MKIFWCVVSFLTFSLLGAGVLADYFIDEFDEPDGPVGDDWVQINNGTLKMKIKGNQLQISGKQAADWVENSVTRDVTDLGTFKSVYVRTKSNAFHPELSLRNADTGAYLSVGASHGWHFVYAASLDAGWNGWLDPPNPIVLGEGWTEFGIIQTAEGVYKITVNDRVTVDNVAGLDEVTHVRFNTYSLAGIEDTMYVEYVEINREDAVAVTSMSKLATTWAATKAHK